MKFDESFYAYRKHTRLLCFFVTLMKKYMRVVKWKYTDRLFDFVGIGNKVGQTEKGPRNVCGYRATALVARIYHEWAT